jgi:phosphatidylserine decarboxylase
MFHKEGFTIILISFFLVAIIALLAHFFVKVPGLRIGIQVAALILLVLVLQFFRNPSRIADQNPDHILAPVDGKVVIIDEVLEPEYFKDKRQQVSIFMSPIDVHVTRYPASGVITFSKYHPGKYLVAWHPKSSTKHERTTIVVKTSKFGEVLYRQIAGAVARRIVNYAQEGDSVLQGSDAGFIKFGSRVDLFLPLDAKINVSKDQHVVGAKTIIATTINEKE